MTRRSVIGVAIVAVMLGFAGMLEARAAEFTPDPTKLDPYKNFKFRLKWEGHYIAGVSAVSSLDRDMDAIEYRSGGDPSTSHKSPGRDKYEPITLERGITQDMSFENWAGLVWQYGGDAGSEASLANFRKDLYLEFYNDAGQLTTAYNLHGCWPSEYKTLPDLDAGANAITIEHLKLECEDWERDKTISEPAPAK
jgi:phage tail-like protein